MRPRPTKSICQSGVFIKEGNISRIPHFCMTFSIMPIATKLFFNQSLTFSSFDCGQQSEIARHILLTCTFPQLISKTWAILLSVTFSLSITQALIYDPPSLRCIAEKKWMMLWITWIYTFQWMLYMFKLMHFTIIFLCVSLMYPLLLLLLLFSTSIFLCSHRHGMR